MTDVATTGGELPQAAIVATAAPKAGGLSKEALTAWLSGADIAEDDNTDEITFEQAQRIFGAADAAAVLADDAVLKIKDLVGQAFTVLSVSWRKSTKSEDGAGRYAFMTCVNSDGEQFLTSCGATKVVLQLRKAELEAWLPWQVQLDAVDTNNNRQMLQLIAPEAPF